LLLLLLLLLCARVRRGDGQSWRTLSHLVMVRAHLLLLRRSLRLRRRKTSGVAAGHDSTKEAIPGRYRGRLLRRAGVLRRSLEAGLRSSLASNLELMSQHVDFFLIPVGEGRCG
jgi:hypothetical protein